MGKEPDLFKEKDHGKKDLKKKQKRGFAKKAV